MVTFPYEWKFSSGTNTTHKTNKQAKIHSQKLKKENIWSFVAIIKM